MRSTMRGTFVGALFCLMVTAGRSQAQPAPMGSPFGSLAQRRMDEVRHALFIQAHWQSLLPGVMK